MIQVGKILNGYAPVIDPNTGERRKITVHGDVGGWKTISPVHSVPPFKKLLIVVH